jgi:tetratricopeptide (TPR) repeat protein
MKLKTYLIVFGIFCSTSIFAQENLGDAPTDDLGNVTDAFQEYFFEALKQKAIENYELAIAALEKAEKASKKDTDVIAVITFEKAKNNIQLKKYDTAETQLKEVLEIIPEKVDVIEQLYDLYYRTRDYDKALPIVQKLALINEDYKEDLANLYSKTKQYDKAIALLDELDESWGESIYRNSLRNQIYRVTGNSAGAINNLEKKVDSNPKNEKDYLNLIYLYSEEGNTAKAFETAKELLENNPKSELVHLALYKFYLNEGDTKEALNSMEIVFKSQQIKKDGQYRVLEDFLQFVDKNPQYEADLDKQIQRFSTNNNGQIFEKLGDYYVNKNNRESALKFYEKGIKGDPDNFSLLKNTILLQIDFSKFEEAKTLSASGLELFPAQAILYLLHGISQNNLTNFDAALESLETGIEYLFDDTKMEQKFYEQLSIGYTGKGDTKKALQYTKKAQALQSPN